MLWILVWVLAACLFIPALMERLNGKRDASVYLRMCLGLTLMSLDMLFLLLFPDKPQPIISYLILGTIVATIASCAIYMFFVYRKIARASPETNS